MWSINWDKITWDISSFRFQDWKEEDSHSRSAGSSTESQECWHQPGLLLPPAVHQGKPEAGSHRVPQERSSRPAVWRQGDFPTSQREEKVLVWILTRTFMKNLLFFFHLYQLWQDNVSHWSVLWIISSHPQSDFVLLPHLIFFNLSNLMVFCFLSQCNLQSFNTDWQQFVTHN